jgi:hypothetical protein
MASPITRLASSTRSWVPLIAARSQPDRRQVGGCDQAAIEIGHRDRADLARLEELLEAAARAAR